MSKGRQKKINVKTLATYLRYIAAMSNLYYHDENYT